MKKLLLLLMFIPLISFSQDFFNEDQLDQEFNKIVNLYRSDDFSKAIQLADDFLKKSNDDFYNSLSLYYQGLSYLGLEETEKSIIYFTKSIKLSPKSFVYNSRSDAYARLEEWSKVKDDTESGLNLTDNETTVDNEIRYQLLLKSSYAKFELGFDYCEDLLSAGKIKPIIKSFNLDIDVCNFLTIDVPDSYVEKQTKDDAPNELIDETLYDLEKYVDGILSSSFSISTTNDTIFSLVSNQSYIKNKISKQGIKEWVGSNSDVLNFKSTKNIQYEFNGIGTTLLSMNEYLQGGGKIYYFLSQFINNGVLYTCTGLTRNEDDFEDYLKIMESAKFE